MNTKVLLAVFKRNLVSYFSSPTGYVFICLFVLLCAFRAFWPHEFFNRNLANLDQLTFGLIGFPLIMLVFVPAITMSIWAEERRQGTDELLLTIPAGDLEIVLGKYLAAVAIYTISLLFSLVCNFLVLKRIEIVLFGWSLQMGLGDPDVGLFLGTYVGYWLVGLGMLAVGMVASFLTSNLTVAYILGVIFNAPLVALAYADTIFGRQLALVLKDWSIGERLRDFGRGILNLSGLAYFAMLVVVMLYLCMVLIGRRHWRAGQGLMPNYVFYPILHLLWLASFLTFGIFLSRHVDPGAVLLWLSVAYVVMHAAMLAVWSREAEEAKPSPVMYLVPPVQLAALAAFVVVGMIVARWEPAALSGGLLVGLFVAYVAVHAALLAGWLFFPHRVALLPGQFTVRALSLVLLAMGLNLLFYRHDLRWDVTSEKLSSLSPSTVELLQTVEPKRAVQIEAFISPEVPEAYVQTRLNLLTMLRELEARASDKVQVRVNNTELFSEEAALAKKRYGITAKEVPAMTRGVMREEQIFMGVAFRCGTQKVILPFIDRGISAEYELVRSLATVTEQKRKRVGLLQTDATMGADSMFIQELKKQYDVATVDATSAITDKYDVLLAIQPSTLGPEQMDHFIAAVRTGQPTAIFEDPFPFPYWTRTPGTGDPRQPPGGMNPMMMMGQRNLPKGDIKPLWRLLGVDFSGERPGLGSGEGQFQVVYQNYNPKPKLAQLVERMPEFVFIDKGVGVKEPFNASSEITSGLQHLLFPFPGYVAPMNAKDPDLEFTPLVKTGDKTGTVSTRDILEFPAFLMGFGGPRFNEERMRYFQGVPYTVAAHIHGKVRLPQMMAGEDKPAAEAAKPTDAPAEKKPETAEVNVVLVADIDLFFDVFFRIREQGDDLSELDFDNVTFVLNVLDKLAGDDRFIEIRKRRPEHRTLTRIDERTDETRKNIELRAKQLQDDYKREKDAAEKEFRDTIDKLREDLKKGGVVDQIEIANRVGLATESLQVRKEAKLEELKRRLEQEIADNQTKLNLEKQAVQFRYKLWAVLLPPIPPLLVAVGVFFTRRAREKEGIARSRLRG